MPLLVKVKLYVKKMLAVFGLGDDEQGSSNSGASREENIEPVMKALIDFRIAVRGQADQGKGALMKLADELRDQQLTEIGIRLEDKGADRSVWSLEDPEVLRKELEAKVEAKRKKEEEKRKREQEALRKKSTPGKDFFRVLEPGDFTQFDEEGLPTHKKGKKDKKTNEFGPDVEI